MSFILLEDYMHSQKHATLVAGVVCALVITAHYLSSGVHIILFYCSAMPGIEMKATENMLSHLRSPVYAKWLLCVCSSALGRYAVPAGVRGEREVVVWMLVVYCLRDLSSPFSVKYCFHSCCLFVGLKGEVCNFWSSSITKWYCKIMSVFKQVSQTLPLSVLPQTHASSWVKVDVS